MSSPNLKQIGSITFWAPVSNVVASAGLPYHRFDLLPSPRGASFIARISADGKQQTATQVSPYAVYALTIAADGTIWTAGADMSKTGNSKAAGLYTIFTLEGAEVTRGTVVNDLNARAHGLALCDDGHLFIGAHLQSGPTPGTFGIYRLNQTSVLFLLASVPVCWFSVKWRAGVPC